MKPEDAVTLDHSKEDEGPADEARIKRDLGGRRVLFDRRRRTSSAHFPERRWRRHRRSGLDRRSPYTFAQRRGPERRNAFQEEDADPGDDSHQTS